MSRIVGGGVSLAKETPSKHTPIATSIPPAVVSRCGMSLKQEKPPVGRLMLSKCGAEGHEPPRGCAHRVLSLIPCLVRNGAMCCDVKILRLIPAQT